MLGSSLTVPAFSKRKRLKKEVKRDMAKIALIVDEKDNVATLFVNDVKDGDVVELRDKKGSCRDIKVIGNVPYGHKIAVQPIAKGEHIVKYGEVIGAATRDIAEGEYVHVHNLEALRGRGDL